MLLEHKRAAVMRLALPESELSRQGSQMHKENTLRQNQVKQRLGEGGLSLGTMAFEFCTTGLSRIAAAAGAEFIVFDMEHTGWSIETIRMLMATSRGANLEPIVRVPATQYHFLARALDVGAMGTMVPMVESAEQARQVVDWTKYPPAGRRGAAFGVAHDDYQPGDVTEKIEAANRELLVIVQIETAAGLENVEQIAAVEGVDVLWIGQTDLTNSLGIPWQFEHPKYHEALERVVAACRQHDKAAGFMALSSDEAQQLYQRGFRCLAYSGDLWLYQQALRNGLDEIRTRIG